MTLAAITPAVTVVSPEPPNGNDAGEFANVVSVSKLSHLQRSILRLALENRVREGRSEGPRGSDLYYAEIKVKYYGFEPQCLSYANPECRDMRRSPGSHQFAPEDVVAEQYDAALAAISRAASRLHARGLVYLVCELISRWSGVSLTPGGSRPPVWSCHHQEGIPVIQPEPHDRRDLGEGRRER